MQHQSQRQDQGSALDQEIILDNNRRVYRTPRMGWKSLVRRVIQYGYDKMGQPVEYDELGRTQWRGPSGVVAKLQEYADVHGWRSKKIIKEIIGKCRQNPKFDAGKRVKMCAPRKRKLNQSDINLAGKIINSGSSTGWAASAVNNRIAFMGRGEKAKVDRRTLERTLHDKYDAITHRRQTKGTGSKDKYSTWAVARKALCGQVLTQLSISLY